MDGQLKMRKTIIISLKVLAAMLAFAGLMFLHMFIITEDDYVVCETVARDPSIPSFKQGTSTLHLETYGCDSNEVIVILHDGPGKDFRELLPLKTLAGEYYLVFYDQRGTGLSARIPGDSISMDFMLEDLHCIVKHYSSKNSVSLFAYRWGGILASAYISKYPDDIDKLIIAEPWELSSSTGIQLEVTSWFESLHIRNSDPYARMDHRYTSMLRSDFRNQQNMKYPDYSPELVRDTLCWRYGYLASKVLLEEVLGDSGLLKTALLPGVADYPNAVLFLDLQNPNKKTLFPGPHKASFQNLQSISLDDHIISIAGSNTQGSLNVIYEFLKQ